MKFKKIINEDNRLYIMLMCEDGVFAGSGDINDLWSFAMEKIDQSELMGSSRYYMCVKYSSGEFVAKHQQALFRFLREYRDPNVVLNRFKIELKKNKPMYIEFVTDNISFRIGTADTFSVFDEDDKPADITDIASKSGVKRLRDGWYDQIL